jgi:exopolyphosphatase/guanosine-5'-triphosphate,3'-diphosphate pyrophosphatase
MSNRRASIDIGSNSTLLLVMDVDSKTIVDEYSTITSLGKDLDKNGVFLESTMEATFEALSNYANICKEHGVDVEDIIVTATEASRVAKNAAEFFAKVYSEIGLTIKTITGEGEAYYTALGIARMLQNNNDNEIVIMDVGGASTELIHVSLEDFKINNSISLPVGSVRTTDWIEEGIAEEKFNQAFDGVDFSLYTGRKIICVAGTMTTLALMMDGAKDFDRDVINNLNTNINSYENFVEENNSKPQDKLESDYPYLGKRAFSIKGGASCALRVLKQVNANELSFSTYGLRYGTAINGDIDGHHLV